MNLGVGTYSPIRRPRIPRFKGGESVIRLSLGRRLVNLLPVAQRTNAFTVARKPWPPLEWETVIMAKAGFLVYGWNSYLGKGAFYTTRYYLLHSVRRLPNFLFSCETQPASLSVRLLIIELIIIDERIVRCKFPAFPAFFSLVVLLYFLV